MECKLSFPRFVDDNIAQDCALLAAAECLYKSFSNRLYNHSHKYYQTISLIQVGVVM